MPLLVCVCLQLHRKLEEEYRIDLNYYNYIDLGKICSSDILHCASVCTCFENAHTFVMFIVICTCIL